MSYDLTLFRVAAGADASATYLQIVDRQESESADLDAWMNRPIADATRAEMWRIANALKTWRPALIEFRPKSALPWIELNDEDLGIQFEVYDGSVGVTIPYFQERTQEIVRCLQGCLETLSAAAGYSAYDPQLERIVTLADVDKIAAQYRSMDRILPEIAGQSRESIASQKRPWWKVW